MLVSCPSLAPWQHPLVWVLQVSKFQDSQSFWRFALESKHFEDVALINPGRILPPPQEKNKQKQKSTARPVLSHVPPLPDMSLISRACGRSSQQAMRRRSACFSGCPFQAAARDTKRKPNVLGACPIFTHTHISCFPSLPLANATCPPFKNCGS